MTLPLTVDIRQVQFHDVGRVSILSFPGYTVTSLVVTNREVFIPGSGYYMVSISPEDTLTWGNPRLLSNPAGRDGSDG